MNPTKSFLRSAGVAGVAAGLITFLIWLLPWLYGRAASLEQRIALHFDPVYMTRQWLSFINVFLILVAGWGLAGSRLRHSPGAASTGMLFLLFYGVAELLGRSSMIFVREYGWTHRLVSESDPTEANRLVMAIQRFDEIWGGAYALLLIAFVLSTTLFAWAMRGGGGLQRIVCWALVLASALGTVAFMAAFARVSPLQSVVDWAYPLIQPGSRILIGAWLLSEARVRVDDSC